MEGLLIKEFLIATGADINSYEYIDNTKIYTLDELPDIYVKCKIFKDKMNDHFGIDVSNYLCRSLRKDGKINIKNFLKFLDK